MKLHEYQSKAIFAQYDIPIPRGRIVTTPAEAKTAATTLGGKGMVKSQVLPSGRGMVGGVQLAHTPEAAEAITAGMLARPVRGFSVEKVLIEQAIDIQTELYLSILVDRTAHGPVMIACADGGIDIETVAKENPEAIIKLSIDPLFGLWDFQVRNMAYELGLRNRQIQPFVRIAQGLYQALIENDANLVEINPLVVNEAGKFVAVDGRIDIDDNALFRHPQLVTMRDEQETKAERKARQMGMCFVALEGDVACLVNGSGLAMTTIDCIKYHGGEPANFLDIRGGAKATEVALALQILAQQPQVKVILGHIFGGLTRCDEVARGILMARDEYQLKQPLVIHLAGTNQAEGWDILKVANFPYLSSLGEAAQKAVALAKEGNRA